jgi:autotransporter-associated beta strand protein
MNAAARINSDNGTLTISTNAITGNDNLTVGGAGNISIGGGLVQNGTGGLIKDGAGTLLLSGGNAYTGSTQISGGVVNIPGVTGTNANALGVAPSIAPGNAGYASANIILDGGTLWDTNNGNGGTYIQAARGITLTANGGKVGATDNTTALSSQNVAYAGVISLASGVTSATLYKVGDGEFRASPPSTTTGFANTKLEIDNGFYRAVTGIGSPATGDQAFGQVPASYDASAILLNGTGTARGNGGVAIGVSAGVTTPANRGITIGSKGATFITNASWTIQSIITGAGGIIVNENGWAPTSATSTSTLTLTGSNTYQGSTLINDGTLEAKGGSAIPDGSAVTIASSSILPNPASSGHNTSAILRVTNDEVIGSLAGGGGISPVTSANYGSVSLGGTLTTGGNNASTSFIGPIAGAGGLTKAGTGTFTVTGTNTYTGQTTVTDGALKVNAASQTPLLSNANGTDIKGGRVVFDYTGGSSPAPTILPILQAGYPSNFTNTANVIHSTTGDVRHGLGYSDSNSLFTVAYTYYGDTNLDGKVDTGDFMTMSQNFGKTGQAWVAGDFNYDGKVNALDFNAVATNFGATQLTAPPVLGALVPEPASLALLAVPALALRRHRRQKA